MTLREAIAALHVLARFQISENAPYKGEEAAHQTQDWCVNELRQHELKRQEHADNDKLKREYAADVFCCIAFALNAGHYYDTRATNVTECVDRLFSWSMRDLNNLDDPPSFDRYVHYEDREIAFYTEEFVAAYDNDNGMASEMAKASVVALARWLWCMDLLYAPRPDESRHQYNEPCGPCYGDGY